MIKVATALAGVARIAFDTAPIIYFIEANPRYDALVSDVFKRVDGGQVLAVTSCISVCEVLIVPIRNDNVHLRNVYKNLLLHSDHFETIPITADIAELGATLRARYGLRTPDALQIASAIETHCDVFLTNDFGLQRVSEIRVLVLDELKL